MRNGVLSFCLLYNRRVARPAFYGLSLLLISISISSCTKDKTGARYAALLQHKWMLKSTSDRFSIGSSYQSSWQTTPFPAGYYREFKSDGTWTTSTPGFSQTEPYQLHSDSIIYLLHPTTVMTMYAPPDTVFIRKLNDSLFVWYSRSAFTSPNYSRLDERIDTLIR